MQKYLLFAIFVLALINPVLAVTASCGSPVAPGDYRFRNFDSTPVRVFINTGGTSISASPNGFTIPVGGEQIVQLRAPTDTYMRLFVTYTDTVNNFSASIECPMFASSGSSGGYTTTTTQPSGSCSSYTSSTACRTAGCTWITIGLSGYCTGSIQTTTTTETTSIVTTTTTPFSTTTTTQQSSCIGRSFTTCPMVPGCEWVGSPTTGYCRSVSSTTTPTTTIVLTTTTVSTQTDSGSTSGTGSSGSTSSSSVSSSSTRATGFYDVPNFVQVPANSEKQIKASFYAAKDLTNVKFQVTDIDANWFIIQPSSLQTISRGQTVNLTITIRVPDNVRQDSYVLKLVAKTDVNYEKPLTLAVTEKIETSVTTTVTTTTVKENKKPTGFFVSALDLAKSYWYVLLIPIVLLITLATLPLMNENRYTKKKGTAYTIDDNEYDYKQDHLEIKFKEPEVKQIEQPKQQNENYKIKNKVIKEIRERALKDSKKRY